MTMIYGGLGHIKEVKNVSIDDFQDEIVCTVSGYTDCRSKKMPFLSQVKMTYDKKEGVWIIH